VLTDIGFPAYKGKRSPMVESVFEYGPRVGCWRLLRIFRRFDVKISMLGVVRGMMMYPELTRAFAEDGHEVVSHGWRWLDYCQVGEDEEREHIRLAVRGIEKLTGAAPAGWFSGRPSVNTRRLIVEHGGFLYDRDYLGDELPFWVKFGARACQHLVVPYSYETNDNRFDRNTGFSSADEFARYMIDCFDLLYEEGAERPKIMSLALHDRLIGRPGPSDSSSSSTTPADATAYGFAPAATSPNIGAASIRRATSDRRGSGRIHPFAIPDPGPKG